jgi:CheY-like chemotaxis protein/anti-sigma regulatory factor (Ser/Thr protein kinase)
MSDPVLLERVLTNLLGNAVRYTTQGGVLLAARQRGASVQLAVIDTGCGIAEDQLPLIFREFYRVPGQGPGEDPGLGLGLAIVRRLTNLLGHRLEVRSRPGHGTRFTLTLPLTAAVGERPAIEAQAAAEAPPTEALQGQRVLVIDDDAAVREAMRGQLQLWGLQVVLAADEAQAWHAFDDPAGAPAAVLCDLRLADGADGLTLALQIQARHAKSTAILSGETTAARVQAVRDAGLPLLTKPLRPARLRAQLEAMLGDAAKSVSASADGS